MKRFFICALVLLLAFPAYSATLDLEKLPEQDVQKVKDLIAKLEPYIREREAAENLAKLTFDELYAPLNDDERDFLKSFQDIDPKAAGVRIPYREIATGQEELIVLRGQKMKITKDGKEEGKIIGPQYLPPLVFQKYTEMMDAMQKDLGKRLLVESGYRSSAYQLYLFVYYLKNHEYSIKETVKFVTLPGYSEHGSPNHQAIDFINENGINGEEVPEEFEVLPEYAWLKDNATKFNFVHSYPRNAEGGITFEPWHWRYEGMVEGAQK